MRILSFCFALILLSLTACENNNVEDFPLLGKWNVLMIKTNTQGNLPEPKIDSLKFTIEFLDTGIGYYEQVRIKDTFDYIYNHEKSEFIMLDLEDLLVENEFVDVSQMVVVSVSDSSAYCNNGFANGILREWYMEK